MTTLNSRPSQTSHGSPPRPQASSSQRPRQSSPQDVAATRASTNNTPLKTKKATQQDNRSITKGHRWSPRRARREQWDRCKVREAEATRGHAGHGMQQQPGHDHHRRQPMKPSILMYLCESIANDEPITVDDRRHCGQGKAAQVQGARATQKGLSQNG